jgi:hypothetical protein
MRGLLLRNQQVELQFLPRSPNPPLSRLDVLEADAQLEQAARLRERMDRAINQVHNLFQ